MADVNSTVATNAVRTLNTQGLNRAAVAYQALVDFKRANGESAARMYESLNRRGKALYVIAGIQIFIRRAGLAENVASTAFGAIRCMCAVPVRGAYYLIALDTSIDVNGGVVVTQWVTRRPVPEGSVPRLMSVKGSTMRDSEPDRDYFERFSEINAVTSGIRRTVDGMTRAVLQRLNAKVRQLRGAA
jgi:hypothetical protein